MAEPNKTSALRIRANAPPTGEVAVFSDLAELLTYLQDVLYVEDTTGTDDGILSFGQQDPQGAENRENTLHVLRDVSERPLALRLWSRDKYVDFVRAAVGEVRLFPQGGAPTGWSIADGSNGTPNLTGKSPDESVVYYQFRGF